MTGGVNDWTPNTWDDSWDGNVDQIGPNPAGFDGSSNNRLGMSQPQQQGMGGSPLGGLAQALLGQYGQQQMGMPQVDQYGQQSLDVAPNSAFIQPASTDIQI